MPYSKDQTHAIHHYLITWIEHYLKLQTDNGLGLVTLTTDQQRDITSKLHGLCKLYEGLPYSGHPDANDYGPVQFTRPMPVTAE